VSTDSLIAGAFKQLEAENAALKEENERLKDEAAILTREKANIRHEVDSLLDEAYERNLVVNALKARVAELEANAARYEWLRSQHWDEGKLCVVMAPKISVKLGSPCPSMGILDETIDSFIREKDPANEG